MLRIRHRHYAVAFAALLVLAGVGGAAWWRSRLPRRFAVVDQGKLYRGGTLYPGQLARLQGSYGIGRVISLLDSEAPETLGERDAAARLGIAWENVPLPGNGASTPAERDRLRALLLAPGAPPTLVHCAAGVNRTGLAVGMYRLHGQGWTLEQVMAELRATDFEDEPQHESLRQALAAEAELAWAAPPSASPETRE
ncbi:MAG: tyrosine-protein phosphatase [Planctomycetota bacterium]